MLLAPRTALTLLAGLIAVPMTPWVHTGRSTGPVARGATPVAYNATQREFFLAPDQLTYIRPGLNVKIASVTNVDSGQKPVVEVFCTDDLKQPLDRTGGLTPGVISMRFVVASWDASTRRYTNLIVSKGSPSRDSTGAWTDLENGHYKYTFAAALPTFDNTKPVTVYVGAVRNTTDIVGKNYYAVPQYFDFTPSTRAPATTFTATTLAKCNACHDPLALHGGNYRDIKTCVLCHNPNNMTGASQHFDGQIFFHALHQGKDATVGPKTYPQDIRNCETCHDKTAAGGASWYTNPSSAACGSCHDTLNFVTGANHPAGPAPDSTCASCHVPDSGHEFDASVKGAHVIPLKSSQLKGYKASIESVTNVGPGQKPTVTFKLQNGDGSAVDPGFFKVAANGQVNILLGGPTSDYGEGQAAPAQPFRENGATATFNKVDGTAVYTFTNAIPAGAKGTYAVSIETRRAVVFSPAPSKGPATINEGAVNPTAYVAVTGKVTPRRQVVSLAKCNACHDNLENVFSHGNQRITIDHCVICHNPNSNDSGSRLADGSQNPPESVSFARMIHRIHTGESLTQDFTIVGHGGAVSNFNEVTYPGDRLNCAACHTAITTAELPTGAKLNVATPRDYFSPQGPATAACLGCHDLRDNAAHAYLNTAPFGEACATCHGTGADLAVDKVHAR